MFDTIKINLKMKTSIITTAVAALALAFTTNAQKVKLTSGNLGFLKGEKTIATEFTYDNMTVGKKKKEADYVAEKVAAYNKKEPGKGDSWQKAWESDKANRFPSKFTELYNKNTSDVTPKANTHGEGKYKMIVNTTYMEPGWNIGVSRMPAMCNYHIKFVEAANPSTSLAEVDVLKCTGQTFGGFDYESGVRIQESFALCAKGLSKFISKTVK